MLVWECYATDTNVQFQSRLYIKHVSYVIYLPDDATRISFLWLLHNIPICSWGCPHPFMPPLGHAFRISWFTSSFSKTSSFSSYASEVAQLLSLHLSLVARHFPCVMYIPFGVRPFPMVLFYYVTQYAIQQLINSCSSYPSWPIKSSPQVMYTEWQSDRETLLFENTTFSEWKKIWVNIHIYIVFK
jgi:hypothetical protein